MALSFWKSDGRRSAWWLTAGVLFFIFANLGIALALNQWNKYFFDALEKKDTHNVGLGLVLVAVLTVLSAAGSVGLLQVRMRLALRWRQWLSRTLISRWLSNRHFYQLTIVENEADNPEARIAEDGRLAIDLLLDFSLGILNAFLAAFSFIGVLWVVGGSIQLGGYVIPGYMVFACILYSGATTFGMFLLGRILVFRVENKASTEARFRYELTRVKDNAETIALIGGDDDERKRLEGTLGTVVERWRAVIMAQGHMTWLNGANLVLAPVVPLLLGAPKYLSGEITLGTLMQAAAAFAQVQIALNWLADNAMRLADWFAASHRVSQLSEAIDRLEKTLGPAGEHGTIQLGSSPDSSIHIRDLNIAMHDGKLVIDGAEAIIRPGEKILVKGDSGSGKSTLIRAIAGLWPWGDGEILRPDGFDIAFMPQRPYFPLGTLRAALLYPHADHVVTEAKVEDILMRCGLEQLISRLDETDQWGQILSGGEQQRLAFARVLLNPPDILIMDEPTSSLDELSQFRMMEYMRDLLPDATVIHAAHRQGIETFHDREIHLRRERRDGPATTHEPTVTAREVVLRTIGRLTRKRSEL